MPYGWLTSLVETIIFLDGDDACFATEKKGKIIFHPKCELDYAAFSLCG